MSDFDPIDSTRSPDPVDGTDQTTRDGALLCDVMLGSLATYLRMCGYDTTYALDRGVEADDRLLEIAHDENRTLLTRDRQLAARARAPDTGDASADGGDDDSTDGGDASDGDGGGGSTDGAAAGAGGLLLGSHAVTGQLRELREAGYDLALAERLARCGRCNGPVEAVGEKGNTPEYAPESGVEDVWRCVECSQHFWKGSHWESVERTLADL